ncbi:helix-turn-helix transcriptional regulator [Chitinophaga solisilvae]|uniref:Helix-turn-helix transcriptional regulator n=1 Tax=Chitinophaga solisilvae TaxID=1233460 RepID=A0A3S1DT25_9BACT|nr:helix-turn-helix transcriptional regulator [Chitinophaga solisilvae]NSL91154.1 helix-turn-helix transcriptional regulator [Chitinophaga solisilvae]
MAGKKQQIVMKDEVFYARLGKRIKELRTEADFTSAEAFAYEIKMSRTQYLEYEKGMDMRLSTLRKLAAVHNITLEELLKGLE